MYVQFSKCLKSEPSLNLKLVLKAVALLKFSI